jgi:hypothetical protein
MLDPHITRKNRIRLVRYQRGRRAVLAFSDSSHSTQHLSMSTATGTIAIKRIAGGAGISKRQRTHDKRVTTQADEQRLRQALQEETVKADAQPCIEVPEAEAAAEAAAKAKAEAKQALLKMLDSVGPDDGEHCDCGCDCTCTMNMDHGCMWDELPAHLRLRDDYVDVE